MNAATIKSAVLTLLQNEVLHPARRQEFLECCRIWQALLVTIAQYLAVVGLLLWEFLCPIVYLTAIAAVKGSSKASARLSEWIQGHGLVQNAILTDWMQQKLPSIRHAVNGAIACYQWAVERPCIGMTLTVSPRSKRAELDVLPSDAGTEHSAAASQKS